MSKCFTNSWGGGLVMIMFALAGQTNVLAHDLVICKASDSARPVRGTFDFTVTGLQGTVSVAAGACSAPLLLPAGQATVRELPRMGALLSAVATCIPHPLSEGEAIENCGRLIRSNFIGGSATVRIVERLPFTTVTFTDEATPFVPPSGYMLTKVSIVPTDINDHTQIVGSATATNLQVHAFIWENGTARDLGTLGGPTSVANGINGPGHVVGSSKTATGQEHAFLWQHGVMRDLGTLGGASSVATAINDSDQVVGFSQTSSGLTHAFLWQDGHMRDLGTLIGPTGNSSAADINKHGQVVGTSDTAKPFGPHAFLWERGIIKDLGALHIPSGTDSSSASAINDGGVAAGVSVNGVDPFVSVFWDQSGIHLVTGVPRSRAKDINNRGQIIGTLDRHLPPNSVAYLWENGVAKILFPQSDVDSISIAINNRGQIVGKLDRFTGSTFESDISFLLTPASKFLSDLEWTSMTNGWGPAERDMSNGERAAADGHTISIRGVTYAKGLGVHANSMLQYDLTAAGSCTAFLSEVGVDDETRGAGSVIFQVWADGVVVYDSGIIRGTMAAQSVNVNITGKSQLRLVVKDDGDGLASDHADWANARLTCQ